MGAINEDQMDGRTLTEEFGDTTTRYSLGKEAERDERYIDRESYPTHHKIPDIGELENRRLDLESK